MDVWERERLEREDLLAQQKANMPIDEWQWLARKQVTPENASLLLVGISPIGYHDLYTHKSPWQEEGIWLIRSLSDEEQLQNMPLIDWYIWADNHPQVRCIDGIARVISPALEAFGNILDSAPSASSKDKPQLAQGVDDDDLKALEALGLLVETMAKQSNKYRIGDTGRPNFAQIAAAMSQQAGDVYGMSTRTLQDRLSTALAAWQEKCK